MQCEFSGSVNQKVCDAWKKLCKVFPRNIV